jgi:hypothetical protein
LGQETQAMDIRLVEICPLVWCDIFGSNRRVFVRRRVGERIISTCGSHHEAWRWCGGALLWHSQWFI